MLERYLKLKTELEEGVKKVGTFFAMRSCLESGSGPSSAVITPQKRRSDGSTPLAKRQAIDTPTRNIISRIEAPTSPFVSVSCFIMECYLFIMTIVL